MYTVHVSEGCCALSFQFFFYIVQWNNCTLDIDILAWQTYNWIHFVSCMWTFFCFVCFPPNGHNPVDVSSEHLVKRAFHDRKLCEAKEDRLCETTTVLTLQILYKWQHKRSGVPPRTGGTNQSSWYTLSKKPVLGYKAHMSCACMTWRLP